MDRIARNVIRAITWILIGLSLGAPIGYEIRGAEVDALREALYEAEPVISIRHDCDEE